MKTVEQRLDELETRLAETTEQSARDALAAQAAVADANVRLEGMDERRVHLETITNELRDTLAEVLRHAGPGLPTELFERAVSLTGPLD